MAATSFCTASKRNGISTGINGLASGGGFENRESPEDCLLREVHEETGLTLTSYRLRGVITFVTDRWETEYMFLYTADGFLVN